MNFTIYYDETLFQDGRSLKQYSNLLVYNKADAYIAKRNGFQVNMPLNSGVMNQANTSCFIDAAKNKNFNSANKAYEQMDPQLCSKLIHINPPNLCYGINVYTMDPTNKRVQQNVESSPITVWLLTESYNQPRVCQLTGKLIHDDFYDKLTPLSIDEPNINKIYTVNSQLAPFEMAIMLKYYAINYKDVKITEHLYRVVHSYFDYTDTTWFKFSTPDAMVAEKMNPILWQNLVWQNKRGELRSNNQILNVPSILYVSGPAVTLD